MMICRYCSYPTSGAPSTSLLAPYMDATAVMTSSTTILGFDTSTMSASSAIGCVTLQCHLIPFKIMVAAAAVAWTEKRGWDEG